MRDGCHIFGNGKSSKTTKKNQHHKFPSGLGYPKPEGKDEGESYTLFRTSPPSSAPPLHSDGTSRSHCAVSLSLRGEPPHSFLCAPLPSSAAAATSPQPHPRLVGAGGVVAFGATKPHDFYKKVRNYCVKPADFLPNSPSSPPTLHTLPIGLVALACTLPGTIRTENLRKTPSSHFPPPRRTPPSQDRYLLQILCKNGDFARDFEGKNERKNSPSELFHRPFSPKTGEKRAENHKQALRIVHFVVFLTSWLPIDTTISPRKTQNQHFSAQLFRRRKFKTDGHFRHNTHKSTLQNEEIRENSAFL